LLTGIALGFMSSNPDLVKPEKWWGVPHPDGKPFFLAFAAACCTLLYLRSLVWIRGFRNFAGTLALLVLLNRVPWWHRQ
jgi:hypothetical protein